MKDEREMAEEENREKQNLERQYLNVLTQDYVLVYDVDLYADRAEVVKIVPRSHVQKMQGIKQGAFFTYSEHIKKFAEQYVIGQKQEYRRQLDIKYILQRMEKVSRYSFRFDSIPNLAGNEHYEVSVVRANPSGFDGRVLIVSREIDDIVKMEKQRQKELEMEREYLELLTQDFMVAYHVNLNENTSALIKVDRRVDRYNAMQTSLRSVNNYMERIDLYCRKFVAPNLRAEFLQVMTPQNIRKELKKGFRFVYRYRTLQQESGRQFFEAQVFRMEEGDEIENVLIGFRSIDDVVTAEQRHQIELEERIEHEQNQNEVLAALGRGYQAIFRIDLQKDTYECLACHDAVLEYYDKMEPSASRALLRICENAVDERFVERMRRFFDLNTLAERLRNTDSIEMECVIRDGNWHRARFIAKRRDQAGEAVSVLYVTQVIDEEKRYQERLLSRVESANLANRAKTEFISQVAHDIRTPLNAIIGFLEIARANPADAETVAYALDKMYLAGTFLKELVTDVLDISKMESSKVQLKPKQISLSAFFEEIAEAAANKQTELGYQFHLKTSFSHDLIIADRLRLKQIYSNILSNAIKYTPSGGTIELIATEEEQPDTEKVRLLVEIRDTGIGMSEEFMDIMFNEYERAVDTRINEVSGYGLGLAIVKRLVDLMGGMINVKSQLGKGTSFSVSLEFPYVQEADSEQDTAEKTDDAAACAGMHLLVAEDNELNREVITELLKLYGMTCDCVENGAICLRRIQSEPEGTYDAILMDMQMPVMNGIEATRQIRSLALPWIKTLPIIAMTANALTADIQNCLDAGMNVHLSKPVDMAELLRILAQVRQKHG